MYRVDKASNNVVKLEQRLFKDLKIKERDHLQEWIAKNPEILGEELLIIQKEYDGFNETTERLDLLALDKDGGLVIIENKLDDTGRNVVWQAIKYTSYCSTLTTKQIITIYQQYLDKWGVQENAKENILEFLGREDDNDLLLNRKDQRMILVANHFRKEVTSSVLWLLNHDIQIQCFRATPYSMGDDIFLQVEQIIPLPETKEFIIDIKEKEKEEKDKSKAVEESELLLIKFWGALKDELSRNHLDFLERVSAKPYYSLGFWKGNGKFAFCLGRNHYRVELYFSNDPEKTWIDKMYQYKETIEQSYGAGEVVWERLENKKASRIKVEMKPEIFHSLDGKFSEGRNWEQINQWFAESMKKFYHVIFPVLDKVQNQ